MFGLFFAFLTALFLRNHSRFCACFQSPFPPGPPYFSEPFCPNFPRNPPPYQFVIPSVFSVLFKVTQVSLSCLLGTFFYFILFAASSSGFCSPFLRDVGPGNPLATPVCSLAKDPKVSPPPLPVCSLPCTFWDNLTNGADVHFLPIRDVPTLSHSPFGRGPFLATCSTALFLHFPLSRWVLVELSP